MDDMETWAFFEQYAEPVGISLYLGLCVVLYYNCNAEESRLAAKLEDALRKQDPQKSGSEPNEHTENTSSVSKKRGKGGSKGGSLNLIYSALNTVKTIVIAVLTWISTRKVRHYGKLEWRDITYLLWHEGNKDGLYLVSECIPHEGCFELAVCLEGTVHRYLIKHDKRASLYGIHESCQFSDLYGVIAHYRSRANGLCCRLERNAWTKNGLELLAARKGKGTVTGSSAASS